MPITQQQKSQSSQLHVIIGSNEAELSSMNADFSFLVLGQTARVVILEVTAPLQPSRGSGQRSKLSSHSGARGTDQQLSFCSFQVASGKKERIALLE